MNKFLLFIGYKESLELKNRFTYIITGVSIFLAFFFLVFYIFAVHSSVVTLVTILCLVDFFSIFVFLKKKMYTLAKLLLIFGFLFQEFSVVFLWFPKEANFNYFFFVITPITFFIYDFDIKKERTTIVVINFLATILLLASEIYPLSEPVVILSDTMIRIFSSLSILTTLGSISIVYYFYSHNLSLTHKELNYLAETDGLTNVFNRRTLYREGEKLFLYSKKYNRRFTFMIFDIDHFKNINDRYGHPVGDKVLIQLTELITENTRQHDIFSRYGGEEFALILKDTSTADNIRVAENLRKIVGKNDFVINDEIIIHLTMSIGVTEYSDKYSVFDELVRQADKALYQAKEEGRNRIVFSSSD